MPRFVVLYHVTSDSGDRKNHWDLLLERPKSGGVDEPDDVRTLVTWALESQPIAGQKIKALRLEDHRRAFLSFEGPLSNGRGLVERQLEGEVEWISSSPDLTQVSLDLPGGKWLVNLRRIRGEEFEVLIEEQ